MSPRPSYDELAKVARFFLHTAGPDRHHAYQGDDWPARVGSLDEFRRRSTRWKRAGQMTLWMTNEDLAFVADVIERLDAKRVRNIGTALMARKLGLAQSTVNQMCRDGRFPGAFKASGWGWCIPEGAVPTTRAPSGKDGYQ